MPSTGKEVRLKCLGLGSEEMFRFLIESIQKLDLNQGFYFYAIKMDWAYGIICKLSMAYWKIER